MEGDRMNEEKVQELVRELLEAIGENPNDPELKETPRRIADMYKLCLQGKKVDPRKFLKRTLPTKHSEMITTKGIKFFSLCPHHLLPWFGKAYIAYIPNGRIIGLSKFISLVEVLSQRFQLQETFTSEIADLIWEELQPFGVMVVVKALHTCTFIRGRYDYSVMSRNEMITVTSALRGVFRWHEAPRIEALRLFFGGERDDKI